MFGAVRKRIITLTAVAVIMLAAFFPFRSSAAKAETTPVKFDETDIMTDLSESIGSDGQAFDITEYGFNASGVLTVHNLVEYGYSTEETPYYGLYLYLYNEPCLDISVATGANSVSMAVRTDSEGKGEAYERFALKFCSRTEGENAGLFYKFKIEDHVDGSGKTLYERVKPEKRIYNFGALYLNVGGELRAYNFGLHCEFTGYAKGLDESSTEESTLKGAVSKNDTISFDLHSTFYRPETEYKDNVRMQLNSVYFSVPESYFAKYGSVVKISGDFREYKTRDIIVTNHDDLYKHFLYNEDTGLYYNDKYHLYSDVLDSHYEGGENYYYHYGWTHNPYLDDYNSHFLTFEEGAEVGGIPYLFKVSADTDITSGNTLSGEELLSYIERYSASYTGGDRIKFNGRDLSGNLFYGEADEGRKSGYNMFTIGIDPSDETSFTEYDLMIRENQRSWWSTLWKGPDYEQIVPEQFAGIQAILEVDPTALSSNVADTLFIDESDVADFTTFVQNEKSAGRRTILFRFAVTDYLASDVTCYSSEIRFPEAYRSRQTLFFDFSVISLTFCTGGVYREIPAVAGPIDIAADVTPPVQPENPVGNWLSDLLKLCQRIFGGAWKWIKIVFWVIVGLILLALAVRIIRFISGLFQKR